MEASMASYPKDVVDACGRHDLRKAVLLTLQGWVDEGVPNQFYLLGSERLGPLGVRVIPRLMGQRLFDDGISIVALSARVTEALMSVATAEHGPSRETIFALFLLRAALGHIYIWKMVHPEGETGVPDPVYLYDAWRNVYGTEESPKSVSVDQVMEMVRVVPSIRLCDVDHPELVSSPWHSWVASWIDLASLYNGSE